MKGIINSYYPSLTKSEQKVASYVLDHLEDALYYSVTDLAYHVGVGETTVLRFCRKIGLKGYQEFKLALAQTVSEEEAEDQEENFIHKVQANTIQTIRETATMLSDQDLESAITYLEHAKTICFFGVGTSGLTALDAKSRFLRIGRITEAIADSHLQSMTAATLGAGDVVVALSVSGSTRDTIQSLKVARENGATVIAITYYSRSPITEFADIVLPGGGKESPLEGGSLTAKISQLFMIDLLCTGLSLRTKEETLRMRKKTAESVVDKIY
ncbi:MurR/RpiR family transcriptional regulator [Paenalkalicoccus suaedae]|uniref:MurR/RpiR family transcriptional regulator n=2 Tax=Paenalkalicoccus suaedae TaxID=2592382 RepID=A0A859FKL5_9BACI|nr:MurR/RpiR family transcriptional regulator [Paenalkalicoccus suaedae]